MLAMQTCSFLLKMLRSELSPVEHCRRPRTGIPPVAHFLSKITPEATHFFFCSVLDRKRTIKLLKAFMFHLHGFWLVVSLQTLNWSSAPSLPSVFLHVIHFWLQRARQEHDVFCMQAIRPLPLSYIASLNTQFLCKMTIQGSPTLESPQAITVLEETANLEKAAYDFLWFSGLSTIASARYN